jgi:selenocysteine lyase/cysteine desulfurase
MRPLRHLETSRNLRLETFPVDAAGLPDFDALSLALRPSARGRAPDLLVVTAASNVTGAILPLAAIIAEARARQVPVLVDGSQLVGHRAIHLDSLGADWFAFSGHKALLGPGGTGGLYIAPGRDLPPLIHGGTGSVSESEDMPRFLPDAQEAGTHNLPALAGLGAALRWLEETGLSVLAEREEALLSRLEAGLLGLPGLRLLGPAPGRDRLPILSLLSEGLALDELARELDRRGIAARMGLHCAPAAHRSLGSLSGGGSLRFSPGPFTTAEEIDDCLEAVKEILS